MRWMRINNRSSFLESAVSGNSGGGDSHRACGGAQKEVSKDVSGTFFCGAHVSKEVFRFFDINSDSGDDSLSRLTTIFGCAGNIGIFFAFGLNKFNGS